MFIVLEGIDGAGTGAQSNAVAQALRDQGLEVVVQEFPDHHFAIYKNLLHPALHQEIELDPDELFLLFLTDQARFRTKLASFQRQKAAPQVFIADRYFTTNLVYNCTFPKTAGQLKKPVSGLGQSFTIDQAVELAALVQIVVPDLTIFLDVSPEIAVQRKAKESGHEEGPDRYESSVETQRVIRARYRFLIENSVFCSWTVVDGEGSLKEVTERIIKEMARPVLA